MALSGTVTVGIDIGTNDSIIAYVGKSMVDVVQNEVSSRQTPTVVGFSDRDRLIGDAASTVIKSNNKNTVRNFRHIMGPVNNCQENFEAEKFWSLAKMTEGEDGLANFEVKYKDETCNFNSTQICSMYLTKMKETAEKWCDAKVSDVVISVPAYFNDFQRQAMLDAAEIAGLNSLRLMNEHTATALAYGIYRINQFDSEKPTVTAFGHMGHSSFSISIVSFTKNKLVVLAEKTLVGVAGRAMDEVLIRHVAEEFKAKKGIDPLSSPKVILKLHEACVKSKKILSANEEAPLNIECLMEDEDLNTKIKRDKFVELCLPLRAKCETAVDEVIEMAKKKGLESVEDISFVEIIGGASRVPWFQEVMSEKFGKELSRTLNADECIARGCALQAAILHPAYKVRDFKVEDNVPYPVSIAYMGSNKESATAEDADKEKKEKKDAEGDEKMGQEDDATANQVLKKQEVFWDFHQMGTRQHITWYRKGPFSLSAEYSQTGASLGTYQIALPKLDQKKKIKIEAKMNIHGIFSINSAHIADFEDVREIVKEKREIKEEESSEKAAQEGEGEAGKKDEPMPDANGEGDSGEKKEGEGEKEKKKEEKKTKYEWVEVEKVRTKARKTNVEVTFSGTPGLDKAVIGNCRDIETKMISETAAVRENDEKRNDLEAYIYSMRDKFGDCGACKDYMKTDDRETFQTKLTTAEDWLYDHFDATTPDLIDKLGELKITSNPALKRKQDREDVKEACEKILNTLGEIRTLAINPSGDYCHIDPEKRNNVTAEANKCEEWLNGAKQASDALPMHENPSLTVGEIKHKRKEISDICRQVMSEPKPAPEQPEATNETTETAPQEGAHAAAAEPAEGAEEPTAEKAADEEKKAAVDGEDQPDVEMEDASAAPAADSKAAVEQQAETAPAADSDNILVD